MNSIGQYAMVSQDQTLNFGNRTFRVVLYGAYNAFGLIGPENNGIAVLDDDRRAVVLDGHCPQGTGYFGPSDEQIAEFQRICDLSGSDFVDFCNGHRMCRDKVDLGSKVAKHPKFTINRYINIATTPVSYNEVAKKEFLRMSKQLAIRLANGLGLNEDQYDIRVNKGGIAVSGEVTLHTDNHYIQFAQMTGIEGFLVRTCKGKKDYLGGRNHFVPWEDLRNINKVCEFILSLS
jgi:hypothetical protein